MPPVKKFSKEDIINTSYEIVMKEGFEGLNARKVAKKLNCSVQPIFHNFDKMEELEKEVLNKIVEKYHEVMNSEEDLNHPYLAKGIAYIRFAKEYPNFFKAIFMQEQNSSFEEFIELDTEMTDAIFETILQKFDIPKDRLKEFHEKIWIFTHGLACLIVTKTICFSDEEVRKLLQTAAQQLYNGYKGENDEKHNRS